LNISIEMGKLLKIALFVFCVSSSSDRSSYAEMIINLVNYKHRDPLYTHNLLNLA
jgi:hypothetical protein